MNRNRPRVDWRSLQYNPFGRRLHPDQGQAVRRFWSTRKGSLTRLALLFLAVWGAYNLIGGDHGLLRLWDLRHREAELTSHLAAVQARSDQLDRELTESPSVRSERGVRERLNQARPNEIVYQFKTVQSAATDTGADGTASDSTAGGAAWQTPPLQESEGTAPTNGR